MAVIFDEIQGILGLYCMFLYSFYCLYAPYIYKKSNDLWTLYVEMIEN